MDDPDISEKIPPDKKTPCDHVDIDAEHTSGQSVNNQGIKDNALNYKSLYEQ